MMLRPVDDSVTDAVEDLYMSSFPASERFPFGNLLSFHESGDAEMLWADDGGFAGFAYVVPSVFGSFLLYLAVVPEMRGRGIGSGMLDGIKRRDPGGTVFLNVEPAEGPDAESRARRIGFYMRNGFRTEGDLTTPDGERYTLMSCGPRIGTDDAVRFYRGLSRLSGLRGHSHLL